MTKTDQEVLDACPQTRWFTTDELPEWIENPVQRVRRLLQFEKLAMRKSGEKYEFKVKAPRLLDVQPPTQPPPA